MGKGSDGSATRPGQVIGSPSILGGQESRMSKPSAVTRITFVALYAVRFTKESFSSGSDNWTPVYHSKYHI